jgi:tRNA-guanine family transglycosylase
MGVGYPLDLVVCVALGVDMFDCVWPCMYSFITRGIQSQIDMCRCNVSLYMYVFA